MRVTIVLRFIKSFYQYIYALLHTINIEISLDDLIYENFRVENYLQDHV